MTREQQISMNIYKSGVIVDLSIGKWQAIAKLDPREVGLETVPEEIYLGHKRLMKKVHMKEIRKIAHKAENWLNSRSWVFPVGSSRFVSYRSLSKLMEKMKEYETDFYAAVEEFVVERYGALRTEMIAHFDKVFDEMLAKAYPDPEGNGDREKAKQILMAKLNSKYPNEIELRSKFHFDFVIFEVAPSQFTGMSSDEALGRANEALVAQEEYRKKIAEKMENFSESVIHKLQAMVLEITGKLSQRTKDGKVNMSTVKGFKNWLAKFRELNFIGLDVDGALDDLEQKLNVAETGDINTRAFMDALEKDIQSIQEMATATNISTVLHKYRRRIETN